MDKVKTNPGQTESCARFLTMFTQNDDQRRLIKWKWETTPAQIRAPLTTKTSISRRYRRYLPARVACVHGGGRQSSTKPQSVKFVYVSNHPENPHGHCLSACVQSAGEPPRMPSKETSISVRAPHTEASPLSRCYAHKHPSASVAYDGTWNFSSADTFL